MGQEPKDAGTPATESIEAWEDFITGTETAAPPAPAKDHGMRNTVIAVGLIIVTIAAIAALVNFGKDPAGSPASSTSYTTATHTVVYEADGGQAPGIRTGSFTLRSDDGGTVQGETNLPMKNKAGGTGLTFTGFGSGDFVYLSVQNEDAAGSVTCRIVVDGITISENTSVGAYKIASCSSRVP